VELDQVGVADQVSPESSVCRPQRVVDQDRHVEILCGPRDTRVRAFARGVGIG
jgi:hypothetical protein